jgi:hypothetical protein
MLPAPRPLAQPNGALNIRPLCIDPTPPCPVPACHMPLSALYNDKLHPTSPRPLIKARNYSTIPTPTYMPHLTLLLGLLQNTMNPVTPARVARACGYTDLATWLDRAA